ncbi:MAG: T9SS type A sorting domain-containing protein [Hymenobacteraceae bacterium]|nr:T9SS type A sorting domain-containing protein [Hymenobacteraceae bacterium]
MLTRTSLIRRWLGAAAVVALTGASAPMAFAQPNPGPVPAPLVLDTLGQYTFTGAIGDEATFPVDASYPNVTFSTMRRGSGVIASISANRFSSNGWTTNPALDSSQYYAFRLTAATGYRALLDSLRFDERRSATGPSAWQVRSSLDGFATVVAGDSIPDDTNTRTHAIDLGAAFAAVSTVEFRLYGFGAEAVGGTWRIDNVIVWGSVDLAVPTGPTVQFATATQPVGEAAGTVPISVSITSSSATVATTVRVALSASPGSATSGADYTFAPQTLTFPAGSSTVRTVNLTITDDALVEGPETIVFSLSSVSAGATIGSPNTLTVTIADNDSNTPTQDPPLETIAAVTTNDALGAAERLNDTVRVRGIVSTVNARTVGYSVGLQDATGGITLFKASAVGTVALAPGDSIEALGILTQFNGLTELLPDSIYVLGTGAALPAPRTVTVLDEATESEIIRIAGPLTIPTPAQWTNAGSGFNVDVTDGTRTYTLRVLRGTDVYGSLVPTEPFSLTGIGGQFDNASPYLEGYQISPRFLTDIVFDTTSTTSPTIQFGQAAQRVTEGATTVQVPVTLTNPGSGAVTVEVMLTTGGSATAGADFTFSPTRQTLTFGAGTTTRNVAVTILEDALTEGDETLTLTLTNPSTGAVLGTPLEFTLTIADNDSTAPVVTPPLIRIAEAVATDAQGAATLSGQAVRVRGIVTSPNIRTAGYSVTMQDSSGRGITVFKTTALGTQLMEQGDELEVIGLITQFNGLTEIIPDSFRTRRTAQLVPAPREVTVLDETTESVLVRINGPLTLVDPAQWTNATGGFTVQVTDGTTTYALRVPRGSAVIGSNPPLAPFRLTGTGGQFDNAAPFFDGYQISPRTPADLDILEGVTAAGPLPATALYPNPTADQLTITAAPTALTATVLDALGRAVLTTPLTAGTAIMSVAVLPAGVYSVRVGTGGRRFVKQ